MAKVLLVEDDPAIADNLQALLQVKGHSVFLATDGPSGVELARQKGPGLILLDLLLPRISGFDVCRVLKQDPKTRAIPIIVMTGLGRVEDVEKAFAAGANDYIVKPFDSERLLKKMDKALAQ